LPHNATKKQKSERTRVRKIVYARTPAAATGIYNPFLKTKTGQAFARPVLNLGMKKFLLYYLF